MLILCLLCDSVFAADGWAAAKIDQGALNHGLLTAPIAAMSQKWRVLDKIPSKRAEIQKELDEMALYGVDIDFDNVQLNNQEVKQRQAFFAVGRWNGRGVMNRDKRGGVVMFISFPGSKFGEDWNRNFKSSLLVSQPVDIFGQGFNLARGFAQRYNELQKTKPQFIAKIKAVIMEKNPSNIYIVGHSLGGAVASICALNLYLMQQAGEIPGTPIALVTFGAPRSFQAQSADRFNAAFQAAGHQIFRIVGYGDPVPSLPTSTEWKHLGDAYFITYKRHFRGGVREKWKLKKMPFDLNFWAPFETRTLSVISHKTSFYKKRLHYVEKCAIEANIQPDVQYELEERESAFDHLFLPNVVCAGETLNAGMYGKWGCVELCGTYDGRCGCVTMTEVDGDEDPPCSIHEGQMQRASENQQSLNFLTLRASSPELLALVQRDTQHSPQDLFMDFSGELPDEMQEIAFGCDGKVASCLCGDMRRVSEPGPRPAGPSVARCSGENGVHAVRQDGATVQLPTGCMFGNCGGAGGFVSQPVRLPPVSGIPAPSLPDPRVVSMRVSAPVRLAPGGGYGAANGGYGTFVSTSRGLHMPSVTEGFYIGFIAFASLLLVRAILCKREQEQTYEPLLEQEI